MKNTIHIKHLSDGEVSITYDNEILFFGQVRDFNESLVSVAVQDLVDRGVSVINETGKQ